MTDSLIEVIYKDGCFCPSSRFWHHKAAKDFKEGGRYRISEVHERSIASHSHYFAMISNAWENLPDHLSDIFRSPEALRKYALVKSGWCDSESVVCANGAEAARIALFIQKAEEFALVLSDGNVVTRYTAKSQSYRAMGREDFQKSKDDVLRVIADLLEVKKKEITA